MEKIYINWIYFKRSLYHENILQLAELKTPSTVQKQHLGQLCVKLNKFQKLPRLIFFFFFNVKKIIKKNSDKSLNIKCHVYLLRIYF